jgi:hypothetical protein
MTTPNYSYKKEWRVVGQDPSTNSNTRATRDRRKTIVKKLVLEHE